MELLETPPALHELDGEPVQQFGMGRLLTHLAEIVDCRHDAAAEVMVPHPVDDDARGQRILRRRDPLGERETAARGLAVRARDFRGVLAVERHLDEPRLHQRTTAVWIAADEEM